MAPSNPNVAIRRREAGAAFFVLYAGACLDGAVLAGRRWPGQRLRYSHTERLVTDAGVDEDWLVFDEVGEASEIGSCAPATLVSARRARHGSRPGASVVSDRPRR